MYESHAAEPGQPPFTSAPTPIIVEPVGPGARVAARLIDGLLISIIGFIPIAMIVAFWTFTAFFSLEAINAFTIAGNPHATTYEVIGLWPSVAIITVSLGVWFTNEVVLTSVKGGNLGKLVIGQRVINMATGRPLTLGQAFRRAMVFGWPQLLITVPGLFLTDTGNVFITLFAVLYSLILLITLVLDQEAFRGFHDKICGTMVIRRPHIM